MSQFVEVKTAELTGPALDWAVAMAEGWEADRPQDGQVRKNGVYRLVGSRPSRSTVSPDWFYDPSTNWAHGGPLLDRHATMVLSHDHSSEVMIGGFWNPSREAACEKKSPSADGPSILVALCRAIVSAKLGDVVQVPAELVGVAA